MVVIALIMSCQQACRWEAARGPASVCNQGDRHSRGYYFLTQLLAMRYIVTYVSHFLGLAVQFYAAWNTDFEFPPLEQMLEARPKAAKAALWKHLGLGNLSVILKYIT